MPPYVTYHLGDSLQKKSVLYAAMKGLVDDSDNFCHLLISYANSLDSIRPNKMLGQTFFYTDAIPERICFKRRVFLKNLNR